MKIEIVSKSKFKIEGSLKVTEVNSAGERNTLFKGKNQITAYGEEEGVQRMLARDLDAMIWTITTGTGGDNETTPPHNPTGGRVPPDPNEEEVRVPVENLAIQAIRRNIDGTVTYMTLAQREQSNSPDINEFGLLTRAGTLFAHFITEDDGGGNATKYPKSELMYWIIEWTVSFTAA